jgi:hypothetical protein
MVYATSSHGTVTPAPTLQGEGEAEFFTPITAEKVDMEQYTNCGRKAAGTW